MKIRASDLPSYSDCNRRGFYRMFRKDIEQIGYVTDPDFRKNVGAAIGTGAHFGVGKKLMARQMFMGDKLSNDDAISIGITRYRTVAEEGLTFDDTTHNSNRAEHQIGRIMTAHFYYVLPYTTPLHVEEEFKAKYKDVIVVGHPDLVEATGIRDLKSGKNKSVCQSQLGVYSLMAKLKGVKVQNLIQDWIPRKKNMDNPKYTEIRYNVEASENFAKQIIAGIKSQYEKFIDTEESGLIPANPMSILCSKKFCPVYGTDFCEITKE